MVPLRQQLGRMEQVRMVMEYLTADESIRGFVEALVLVAVSVVAEAGVAVAAEEDSVGKKLNS